MPGSPWYAVLVTVFLIMSICPADGARVLIISLSMRSHVIHLSHLGLDLARLGHDVRLLVPSNTRRPDFVQNDKHNTDVKPGTFSNTGRFNFTNFHVDADTSYYDSADFHGFVMEQALAKSHIDKAFKAFGRMKTFMHEYNREGYQLVQNSEIMEELRHGGYQFVIIPPVIPLAAIPLAMRVPYAVMHISAWPLWFRVPRLASFTPVIDATDRMTFKERSINFLVQLLSATMFQLDRQEVHVSGGDVNENFHLTMMETFEKSSLWLIWEDPSVGFALPLMPNTIPVGDIAAGKPGLPLPSDLESFLAASKDGVVLVSFGSYIDNLPDDIIKKLCEAFQSLGSGRHVIWKTKKLKSCTGKDNVKTVPWIPQNDLLADPRVRLFITHGGLNSMMETVYHAKPIIVFPFYADQPLNAAAAVAKGYAIRMDVRYFTSDSLLMNIEKMFSDEKYQLNARLTSAILRDRRDTAAERVSHMVEHVIKYGDSHLRTGAFELNLVQFLMLDVFAVVYCFALISAVSGVLIMRFIYRKLCRRNVNEIHKRKSD